MVNETKSRREARREARERRVTKREGESRASRTLRTNARAAILRVGKSTRNAVNAVLGRYSEIGDPAVFDPSSFAWTRVLEENWKTIRAEADNVLRMRELLPPLQEISPDHDRLTGDDKWKVFLLKGYGFWCPDSCKVCPETTRIVEQIPGLESAFFSIFEGGKHLKRHRGPTKAFFTCHLGLKIPEQREACWIEVDGQRLHWDEGKTIVFDDTYKHEVDNGTDEDRVVLLIHVRRPLRFPGSAVGRGIMTAIKKSPFVQDARRNQVAWEKRFFDAQKQAGVPEPDQPVEIG